MPNYLNGRGSVALHTPVHPVRFVTAAALFRRPRRGDHIMRRTGLPPKVVDFSFWSRAMREEYRELLRPLGVVPETVYLATGRATTLQRVAARTAGEGDDFAISAELAAFYFDHFEPPTAEEGPLTIIGQTVSGK
jgi:hypothetical protein